MNDNMDAQLAELKAALGADEVRFGLTWALDIKGGGTMDGLRVEYKDYGQKRWSVVKTAIYPAEDSNLPGVFSTLYDMRQEELKKRESRR